MLSPVDPCPKYPGVLADSDTALQNRRRWHGHGFLKYPPATVLTSFIQVLRSQEMLAAGSPSPFAQLVS